MGNTNTKIKIEKNLEKEKDLEKKNPPSYDECEIPDAKVFMNFVKQKEEKNKIIEHELNNTLNDERLKIKTMILKGVSKAIRDGQLGYSDYCVNPGKNIFDILQKTKKTMQNIIDIGEFQSIINEFEEEMNKKGYIVDYFNIKESTFDNKKFNLDIMWKIKKVNLQ